jgi:hypothetical protein
MDQIFDLMVEALGFFGEIFNIRKKRGDMTQGLINRERANPVNY